MKDAFPVGFRPEGETESKDSPAVLWLPKKVCTQNNIHEAPLGCAYCNSPMITLEILASRSPTDSH